MLKCLGIHTNVTKTRVSVRSVHPMVKQLGFDSLPCYFSITAWHSATNLAA